MARTKVRPKPKGRKSPVQVVEEPGLRDYVLINLVFAAFCLLQFLVVRTILKDTAGINFFFGFLVVAFMTVSAFDYFASRLKVGHPDDSSTVSPND